VKPVWAGLRGTTVGAESGRPSARGNGMRVRSIYPDSPAEKAGLEEGDVVTAVDGRPVESREDFETFLTSTGPGRKVELTVKRKGKDTAAATLTTGRPPEDLGLEVLRREVGLSVVEARGDLRIAAPRRRRPGAGTSSVNGQK
jgi:S1-C subfamily serine protease